MKYTSTATRWQVIVYDYVDGYPQTDKITKAEPILSNLGVISISFSRKKSEIQSIANLRIVGELPSQYRIGNWVILKSKVGAFPNPEEISDIGVGIVRFIGQIADIHTEYAVSDTGLFYRRSTVLIREWSSILHCPVRLEFGAVEQNLLANENAATQKTAIQNNQDMIQIVESVWDPFDYIRLILAFIGFYGSDFKGTAPVFTDEKNKALVPIAEEISRSALYLPHIPKEMLEYLGMPEIEPNKAFSSKGGFAGLVLGVNNGDTELESAYASSNEYKTFDGVFDSFESLQLLYENYKDRPITAGMLSDFAMGAGAWDLLKSRVDNEYNECFTDIWYFNVPNTIESTSSTAIDLFKDGSIENKPKIFESNIDNSTSAGHISSENISQNTINYRPAAKPVVVVRDKPFALKKYLADLKIKSTKWSTLDAVPRVFIDDVYIKSISTRSTFFNSPNYIQPSIADNTNASSVVIKNLTTIQALRTLRPEMNRFGGIQHFPVTSYLALNTAKEEININWLEDASKVQFLWHGLNYRFLSGVLTLKDHDVKIMVGCNIVFKTKVGLMLCAHVDGVSWQFMVNSDGSVTNDCQIEFSHMCMIDNNGDLEFIPSPLINNLFSNKTGREDVAPLIDAVSLTKKFASVEKRIQEYQQQLNKKVTEEKKKNKNTKKKKK